MQFLYILNAFKKKVIRNSFKTMGSKKKISHKLLLKKSEKNNNKRIKK